MTTLIRRTLSALAALALSVGLVLAPTMSAEAKDSQWPGKTHVSKDSQWPGKHLAKDSQWPGKVLSRDSQWPG